MIEQERYSEELYIVNAFSPNSVINNIKTLKAIKDLNDIFPIKTVLSEERESTIKHNPYVASYCQKHNIPLKRRDDNQSIDDFLIDEIFSDRNNNLERYVYVTSEEDIDVVENVAREIRSTGTFVELIRIY